MSRFDTVRYGPKLDQYGEFGTPDRESAGPIPVIVLIHGGFWRDDRTLALMRPLAEYFIAAGIAVWNVEYRRTGARHQWPDALVDLSAAVDFVDMLPAEVGTPDLELDVESLVVVGHSAGGYLALWLGCHHQSKRQGQLRSAPGPTVGWAVGLAPITDLGVAAKEGLGRDAVLDFMGGVPDQMPLEYSLSRLEPSMSSTKLHLVHGEMDDVVPIGHSERFSRLGGDRIAFDRVDSDHITLIDPDSVAMGPVLNQICSHAVDNQNSRGASR